ncbi:VOC family protein [Exiguobacterium aestuarii]|uniref:VOC family protein n=1 Tax=Exiguobacterium aestuarii TaxID=273527 RepID=A0ABW2PLK5_9BACL|nr:MULTISPECIES: VOC family protein [Exiguobacterium]MCT4784965.1 VOC family protein [Exiguobacterium aestuarii]
MNPILHQIGTIFIPVSDIQKARDWYCNLFDLSIKGEILFDHLYVIPLEGTNLVLDSKIYSTDNIIQTPLFHLNTRDIHQAYSYMIQKNIDIITPIEHDHWFNFKDFDGNVIMICKC